MPRNAFVLFLSPLLVAALFATSTAKADDYYWTGGAGDGLWSSAGNWAMDAAGTIPADAAPVRGMKPGIHFDVPAGGLVVTQDYKTDNSGTTGVVVSNIVVTTSASEPVELKIVSEDSSSFLDFIGSGGASVSVDAGVTLTLNVYPFNGVVRAALPKYGAGTLAIDYMGRPSGSRPLVIHEGKVVVLATSKSPRFGVKLAGSDPDNPPMFENQTEEAHCEDFTLSPLGIAKLNGTKLVVNDFPQTQVTNVIPPVLDAGTLSYGDEHVAVVTESSPLYDIEIGRADVVVPDSGVSPSLNALVANASGALTIGASAASVKTLSGTALAGGVEMTQAGSTLTVGTGAGETNTMFQGTVSGTDSTLVKVGANYMLALEGAVRGVTNVVVSEGTLALYRPGSSRRGLVCRYSFDDASNFGHDDGPAGFNLSLGDAGTPTGIAGVANDAIEFPDVAGGYSYLESGTAVRPANFPSGNASFTISVWIRPTAKTCSDGAVICCWGGGGTAKMAMLRFSGTTSIMFVSSGGDYNLAAGGLPNLSNGQWHHIVATYDGTTNVKRFYCDGVLRESKIMPNGLNVNTAGYAIEIGHAAASDQNKDKRYRGGMDEFMVFDYAWSAEEVLAEYNSIPAPSPVVRWTFDGEDPLADTTGNYTLEAFRANDAQPNVTFESGDNICGKAARFTSTSGCLRRETFPEGVLPSGKPTVTLVVRYRPDTMQPNQSDQAPAIAGWGGPSNESMFRLGTDPGVNGSARGLTGNSGLVAPGTDRSPLSSDRTRWYTSALTYDKTTLSLFVDGVFAASKNYNFNLTSGRFVIGSTFPGTRDYYGLVDDVQIFDRVLTTGQIRQIAEQLEASKGKATTSTTTPTGVLVGKPDVTIADGATLAVASVEEIGNLSGDGTVALAPYGRLNVSAIRGFDGTVTGDGVVGFGDNAVIDFGDATAPLVLFEDYPFALGTNVTISTTVTQSRHLIARAASFTDADNLQTWTATVGNREYYFFLSSDGKELYLSIQSGSLLIFR